MTNPNLISCKSTFQRINSRYFFILVIILVFYLFRNSYSQDHIYPVEDFYNRNIELPIDHNNPDEGSFTLYYQLSSNFNFNNPIIFFINDSQQAHGAPGDVDGLREEYQFDSLFNIIRYEPRGRQYSYIEIENEDGSINWEKAYRIFSSSQIVEDIERVRQNLLSDHPNKKIYLYGRSGGGYLVQEYLAKYFRYVERAFIRCGPNPLIMEKLGFIESRFLLNSLNTVDSTVYKKLEKVLDENVVPELNLLWLLNRLAYQFQDPGPIQAKIIDELFQNNFDTYQSYMEKGGYDYLKLKGNKVLINQMGIGGFLRPIECDGKYLLGPPPDYIDPIYYCFRDLSSAFIDLIEKNKVPSPIFPSLNKFEEVETEVFYLAGKNDHMSPYQIGVELGKYFPNYELFISDDNHLFNKHKDCYPLLRNAFFKHGNSSRQLKEAKKNILCKEWKLN